MGHLARQRALRPIGHPELTGSEAGIGVSLATLRLHRQGRQGVGGFTRLGDTNGERIRSQRRRCIAKLAGVMDRRGNSRELLQQVGTHQRGMATGAAGQDLNPLDAGIEAVVKRQRDGSLRKQAGRKMSGHPDSRSLGLLVDLLEHEMAELAFVRHLLRGAELGRHPLLPFAGAVIQLHSQGG